MKRFLITLTLILMLGNTVSAQYSIKELPLNKNFRLVKLDYTNKSGEKAVSNFEYNESGFITKAIWKLEDNSRSGVISYTYNTDGNIIQKIRIFSDSITIMQTFKYNPYSNLLIDHFERSDGTKGKVEYIYDRNQKLIKAKCINQNGWFNGIINYKFNKKGEPTSAELLQNNTIVGNIIYQYNSNGLLIKEYWDFPENWNQTFIYEYKSQNN